MADQKIELEIVMDDGSIKRAFGSIKKEAEETGSAFSNSFKVGSITDLVSAINLAEKSLSIFKQTAGALFNQVLSGERIDAITKRFEILAQQSGLSADALQSGIAAAVDGTVDLEEALQATSNSLINLQTGLNNIPQLFEIARKSALAFGGDTISNFERIQQAVISGNTRTLRSIGIFIDANEAVKAYSSSIDKSAESLSEAEKQQAILNKVLEVGDKNFKNISTSITPLDEAVRKLDVSYGELGDTVATVANNAFGQIFLDKIKQSTSALDALNIKLGEWLLGKAPTATENVRLLTFQLQELEKSLLMSQVRGDVDRSTQIMAEMEALRQKLAVEKEAVTVQTQKNTADLQASTIATATASGYLQVTDAMRAQFAVMDAYEEQLKKMQLASQQIAATIKAGLVNSISQSIQTVIGNLVKGKAAFADFGKMILGLMGQLAIQVGTVLLSTGIGMLSLKFLDPTGAIAAGLGLIALGSVLSAIGEGGGGTNEGVTANGGGVAFTGNQPLPADQQGLTAFEAAERQAPNTVVNFTVQGDILDSDSTQSRIVALLNDAIDTKGAVVRGLA
jgi:hypothetical protein